jgi:HSP20 family protein
MARKDLDQWLWQVGAELQRISEELTPASPKVARSRTWAPNVDVTEGEAFVLVKAELAGVRGEEITIAYHPERHSLTIRGARLEENCTETPPQGAHQLEIQYGPFEREAPLPPAALNIDALRAQYHNGFLLIVIPKKVSRDGVVVKRTITLRNT